MNHQQRDAILAGLRLLQQRIDDGENIADINDIYTDTGRHEGLRSEEIDELCERLNIPFYVGLEIEFCVEAENRWGETFVEAVRDPERAQLNDVQDSFWTVYGRCSDGPVDGLVDAHDHELAVMMANVLSICAYNRIPVTDNSPEGRNDACL